MGNDKKKSKDRLRLTSRSSLFYANQPHIPLRYYNTQHKLNHPSYFSNIFTFIIIIIIMYYYRKALPRPWSLIYSPPNSSYSFLVIAYCL